MSQISSEARYTQMEYRRCGASGLKLPSLRANFKMLSNTYEYTQNYA
jgi:hypothetical protein